MNNFIVSSWSFLRLFIETADTANPCVYVIVYRHSIIHPPGVFDRLYPNEHSLIHPPRDPRLALSIFFPAVCRTHGNRALWIINKPQFWINYSRMPTETDCPEDLPGRRYARSGTISKDIGQILLLDMIRIPMYVHVCKHDRNCPWKMGCENDDTQDTVSALEETRW